ncbi:MAG: hypothetical protein JNL52_16020 [Flavobacteriales bacterium]|nr:hypothetical protein [Flavobacteriales bacterium]
MRPFTVLLPALSVLTLTFTSCSDPAPNGAPVVVTGELTISSGNVALVDCDLASHAISGALRDSVMARFSGAAALSVSTHLWLTVHATDSTLSAGSIVNVLKSAPCLMELPGTYAMEPLQDGQMAAKINLDVSGRFSLAVAPGDGTRKDDTGDWLREKDEIVLRGQERKYILRIVHPDAVVLEDSTLYGKVLRMTRR